MVTIKVTPLIILINLDSSTLSTIWLTQILIRTKPQWLSWPTQRLRRLFYNDSKVLEGNRTPNGGADEVIVYFENNYAFATLPKYCMYQFIRSVEWACVQLANAVERSELSFFEIHSELQPVEAAHLRRNIWWMQFLYWFSLPTFNCLVFGPRCPNCKHFQSSLCFY